MISSVTFDKTTYNEVPHKFEAGTPHIAGAIGFGAAIDFMTSVGFGPIVAHERRLLEYATNALTAVPGLRLIGTAPQTASILSFVLDGVHAHDIGTIVDTEGVAIRTGQHCTQPVMDRFGVPATARASSPPASPRAAPRQPRTGGHILVGKNEQSDTLDDRRRSIPRTL